jgi:hypothetical protein
MNYINQIDDRFGKIPMGVGSAFQGLNTKSADEFDLPVSVILEGTDPWRTKTYTTRFYNLLIL